MPSDKVVNCSDESLKIKTKRRKASAISKGEFYMDIDLYQLIQQVAEMTRRSAIDKAAADVVQSDVIGE